MTDTKLRYRQLLIPGWYAWTRGRRGTALHLMGYHLVWLLILFTHTDLIAYGIEQVDFGLLLTPLAWLVIYGLTVLITWKAVRTEGQQGALKSPGRMALRRFKLNRLAWYSVFVIGYLYTLALLAPYIAPFDPLDISNVLETRYLSPDLTHLFGTDEFGRDLFSRSLYGARVSLSIGFVAVLIAITLGTLYGTVSAYYGGWVDNVMMRGIDILMAFPVFFLMLTLVAVFEVNIVVMILIMGLTSWMGTARYIRGEVLSLKEQEFIQSAKAIGLPSYRIIFRHLIPNALTPVLVSAALMVGGMISAEAGLSFLGIGIQAPTPTWGNMIGDGSETLLIAWWISFFPGMLLATTIICFNLIADGLRDALSPKSLFRNF